MAPATQHPSARPFASSSRTRNMGRQKGYTPDDYRRLAEEGMSMAETSARLDVKYQSVQVMANRYGIQFTKGKPGRKKKEVEHG